MKKGSFLFIAIFALTILPRTYAQEQEVDYVVKPNFPSCETPQGELKVYYPNGTHGIAGDTGVYTGSDFVYILSDATLSQCFCAFDGSGIQTNWWKVSSLTIDEINQLINDGWIYVPDGSAWGLERAPYMAQNANYSCEEEEKKEHKDDPNDKHDPPKTKKKQSGEVLGSAFGTGGPFTLASTGNILEIVGYVALGTLSLGTAFLLRNRYNDDKE